MLKWTCSNDISILFHQEVDSNEMTFKVISDRQNQDCVLLCFLTADVGEKMCWWKVWDVGEKFRHQELGTKIISGVLWCWWPTLGPQNLAPRWFSCLQQINSVTNIACWFIFEFDQYKEKCYRHKFLSPKPEKKLPIINRQHNGVTNITVSDSLSPWLLTWAH